MLPTRHLLEEHASVEKTRSSRELLELDARVGQAVNRLVVNDAHSVLEVAENCIPLIE